MRQNGRRKTPPLETNPVDLDERIRLFLDGAPHAVAGASKDRAKYGNKVLRAYRQRGRKVYPLNPGAGEIEGLRAYPDLASLPEPIHGLSIVTPPAVTERLVEQAAEAGVRHLWMQPGAESAAAIRRAEELGLNLIADGPCLLVELRYREDAD
jgi:predicted CoA-binding protein